MTAESAAGDQLPIEHYGDEKPHALGRWAHRQGWEALHVVSLEPPVVALDVEGRAARPL